MKTIFLFFTCSLFHLATYAQFNQTVISEHWSGSSGQVNAPLTSKTTTKTDNMANVYVAGAALNSNNDLDIIVQKYNRQGDLLWEQTFGGLLNQDDAAGDLFIDNNNNVYVTGAIANTTQISK